MHGIEQVTVNGAQLGYSAHGSGQDKSSLVFAHGYAMRSTGCLCAGRLDILTRGPAVHALDLRGHGASAAALAGWSYEVVADDVVAFSRALELNGPVLVGHSFGAVVGLLAAIRHPGVFSALCLLEPSPADARRGPVYTLDVLIEHGDDLDALRDGFRKMFVRDLGDKLDLVLAAATLVDPDVHRAQKKQNPHFSIDDQLKDADVPVLLVLGKGDGVVPPRPARRHGEQAAKFQGGDLLGRGAYAGD